MDEPRDDGRIEELEALRAPQRSDSERRRARERVLAGAEALLARRQRPASYWEVLAGWARPGLAAAAVALLLIAGAVQTWRTQQPADPQPAVLEDVLVQTAEGNGVAALLLASSEPDVDAIVAAGLLEDASDAGASSQDNFNIGQEP
jgi:anti-sigma-K factor RskA